MNDGPTTAPSKRLLGHCRDYSKPSTGPLASKLDLPEQVPAQHPAGVTRPGVPSMPSGTGAAPIPARSSDITRPGGVAGAVRVGVLGGVGAVAVGQAHVAEGDAEAAGDAEEDGVCLDVAAVVDDG